MDTYIVRVNGVEYEVEIEKLAAGAAPAPKKAAPAVKAAAAPAAKKAAAGGSVKITAGAAGKIYKIVAAAGQSVKAGDSVIILEAMKMEIPVVAPQDGVVADICCSEGQLVEAGEVIASMN